MFHNSSVPLLSLFPVFGRFSRLQTALQSTEEWGKAAPQPTQHKLTSTLHHTQSVLFNIRFRLWLQLNVLKVLFEDKMSVCIHPDIIKVTIWETPAGKKTWHEPYGHGIHQEHMDRFSSYVLSSGLITCLYPRQLNTTCVFFTLLWSILQNSQTLDWCPSYQSATSWIQYAMIISLLNLWNLLVVANLSPWPFFAKWHYRQLLMQMWGGND